MTVRLSRQVALVTGWDLPPWTTGPTEFGQIFECAAAAGFEGIQVPLPDHAKLARSAGLAKVSALAPARTTDEVDAIVGMWAGQDLDALVLHLGTGFETAEEAKDLFEAAFRAESHHGVPLLIETHRATLTQDPARTLALIGEFPDLRFCADLSHWYTGVEMVYGDFETKLAKLAPVFQRTRMIHGRISDPGCIQVAVQPDDQRPCVEHFRTMWSAVLAAAAEAGVSEFPFVVELLPASVNYARTVERDGIREEEVDRWAQAGVLWDIVQGCAPGAMSHGDALTRS